MAPKTVLFYRDLIGYTGGHQKVADYFQHLESSSLYVPRIAFSNRSRWDELNPWYPNYTQKIVPYEPADADYIFLAGMDWLQYLNNVSSSKKPVVNLIQHVRHADPNEELYQFLSQPAVRICVSQEVASAISATGKVNGPVFTIPNGVNLPNVGDVKKQYDLLILGPKNPVLAHGIFNNSALKNLRICLVDEFIKRDQLHEKMAQSRIALLLPHKTEGFYLPALEAMHFCDLVIVPDCVGNRSFCGHGENCLMPEYNESALFEAVIASMAFDREIIAPFQKAALKTLSEHSLTNERRAFLAVMDDMEKLWAELPAK